MRSKIFSIFLGGIFALRGAFDKALALLRHFLGLLLAHGAAEQIGFTQGVSGEAVGDLHHLFLIHDHAQRLLQNLLQFRQFVFDFLAAVLAVDEIVDHAALNRAGTVERVQGGEIFDGVRLVLAQHVAHAVRFKLEDAGGQSLVENLFVGLVIFERNFFESQRLCRGSARSASARR